MIPFVWSVYPAHAEFDLMVTDKALWDKQFQEYDDKSLEDFQTKYPGVNWKNECLKEEVYSYISEKMRDCSKIIGLRMVTHYSMPNFNIGSNRPAEFAIQRWFGSNSMYLFKSNDFDSKTKYLDILKDDALTSYAIELKDGFIRMVCPDSELIEFNKRGGVELECLARRASKVLNYDPNYISESERKDYRKTFCSTQEDLIKKNFQPYEEYCSKISSTSESNNSYTQKESNDTKPKPNKAVNTENHEKCKNASDYQGCMNYQEGR